MMLEMIAQMDVEGEQQILTLALAPGFLLKLYNAADLPEWVVAAQSYYPNNLVAFHTFNHGGSRGSGAGFTGGGGTGHSHGAECGAGAGHGSIHGIGGRLGGGRGRN